MMAGNRQIQPFFRPAGMVRKYKANRSGRVSNPLDGPCIVLHGASLVVFACLLDDFPVCSHILVASEVDGDGVTVLHFLHCPEYILPTRIPQDKLVSQQIRDGRKPSLVLPIPNIVGRISTTQTNVLVILKGPFLVHHSAHGLRHALPSGLRNPMPRAGPSHAQGNVPLPRLNNRCPECSQRKAPPIRIMAESIRGIKLHRHPELDSHPPPKCILEHLVSKSSHEPNHIHVGLFTPWTREWLRLANTW